MNPPDDGGLNETQVDDYVRTYRRISKATRAVVILVAIGIGTAVAIAIATQTGMAGGEVAHV